ncbi:MAG: bifunctional enoyl-CoA hydratase/phosphate acetyltransferase [Pedobacter sp.]
MIKNLNEIFEKIKNSDKKTIAIACPENDVTIKTVIACREKEIADFILVGDKEIISQLLLDADQDTSQFEIVDIKTHKEAAEKAVHLVVDGKADVVMKGDLHTSVFMRAVLNKEKGLNAGQKMSECTIIEKIQGEGLQCITDCAMNISPNLEDKKQIIDNAVNLLIKLGVQKPKVALLSALEVVNPSMPDTIDAAVLCKMADRGQIKNAIIDGPLALDNILSLEAAKKKKIESPVAGDADIIVAPDMTVANVLRKAITFYANKMTTTTLVGAKAPVVMTSRTEPVEGKLLSIAIAVYTS